MIPLSALDDDTIAATNVLPAYEACLHFGASEAELAAQLGWTRARLCTDGAVVSADETYAHMELMHARPGYADFVLAAVRAHTLSSLGVVGLACKTVKTVGESIACHDRFQHLTNRTARYSSQVDGDTLVFTEQRSGPERPGRALISDYALLVAVQLLRASSIDSLPLQSMRSVRLGYRDGERQAYETFLDAPIELGAQNGALRFDAELLDSPVASADPELQRYFAAVLDRAGVFPTDESPFLGQVRAAVRDGMARGGATSTQVARGLGIGRRTLQRRLAADDVTFAEVLESTLRQLADGYLADESLSLSEVAYLLGYQEQSSFFRAFRRWHDCTPAAYRAAQF